MNTKLKPDFFMASGDSHSFRGPFNCWIMGTLTGDLRNDYVLVKIEPPAIDYRTKEMLDHIIIAGRHTPTALNKLPLSIYIAKIKDLTLFATRHCTAANIEVVTSGDIFSSLEDAVALAGTFN